MGERDISLGVKRFESVNGNHVHEGGRRFSCSLSWWRYLFCPLYLRKWFTASESSHCGKMDWGKSIPNLTLRGQEIDLQQEEAFLASSLCSLLDVSVNSFRHVSLTQPPWSESMVLMKTQQRPLYYAAHPLNVQKIASVCYILLGGWIILEDGAEFWECVGAQNLDANKCKLFSDKQT